MSTVTLILVGQGSEVTDRYSPPIALGVGPQEIALMALRTINNVRNGCNDFAFSVEGGNGQKTKLTLPTGTYTLDDIEAFVLAGTREKYKEAMETNRH